MTITHNAQIAPGISNFLYHRSDTIKQLVQAAIIEMANASEEMMGDYPDLYQDKQSIESGFEQLKLQARDMLEDVIAGISWEIDNQLKSIECVAQVRKIEYGESGMLTDAEVNINFK